MSSHVENVMHNGRILAIIIRSQAITELEKSGKNMLFATPNEFPFQVGIHHRKKNETIAAHFHLPFTELTNFPVQEFFHVISGRVKIDLYDDSHADAKVSEVIVAAGDSIILNTGHGFTFLDDAKMVELKQGPYRGKEQEKRFVQ
ncbi:MAG: hypothetical protein Q8R37_03395 [Nanoarchaeota archaeon]|nr:hypothetical protein [Nanoarchaeota archaeon]